MQREFPSNNFSSALACLAPYSPERYGDYEWERAAVRSEKMSGLNEGVGVGVEFARGSDQGPATLRIDAKAALPSFPFDVVRTRLGKDVVSVTGVGDCSATPALPMLNDAAFATTYPNGAFVVCDAKVVRDRATATILQYLFDAARNTVLAASSIDVQIAKHGSNWRVSEWRKTAIDSVP
ncbi:MAG: hypothetical protein ABIO49_02820 [Dokdonella sp.]